MHAGIHVKISLAGEKARSQIAWASQHLRNTARKVTHWTHWPKTTQLLIIVGKKKFYFQCLSRDINIKIRFILFVTCIPSTMKVTVSYITNFNPFTPQRDWNPISPYKMNLPLRRRWWEYKDKGQGFSNRVVKTHDPVMRISTLILRLNLHYLLKIIAHMFWLITERLCPWLKHSYKFHKCNDFCFL